MRLAVIAAALFAAATTALAQPAGVGDPNCQAAIAFSAERRGAAVLALVDGGPVCEGYTGAGAPDRSMEIWSGTKSIVGLGLAGPQSRIGSATTAAIRATFQTTIRATLRRRLGDGRRDTSRVDTTRNEPSMTSVEGWVAVTVLVLLA